VSDSDIKANLSSIELKLNLPTGTELGNFWRPNRFVMLTMEKLLFLTGTVCILFLLYSHKMEKVNQEKNGLDNIMSLFREKDTAKVEEILQFGSNVGNLTEEDAMLKFYQYLAFPLQGVCKVLKRIGGHWKKRQVDGDKFICMDRLIMSQACLVYSFGVNNDWTFEDVMDDLGCEVHAHDHTVDYPPDRGHNTHFYKLGLGTMKNMDTLDNIIVNNGHKNKIIEYLKIDIEGHELTGLPDWVDSGILKNVNQLALELHLRRMHEGPKFIWLLHILKSLYQLNFRIISQEVNMVAGPGSDGFYSFVEVVFMKDIGK